MSANDKQVAGTHYKTDGVKYQHWDIVADHKLNYFEAQITRYIMRCRRKHGKVDIEKAIHFCQKYLEVYDEMTKPVMRLEGTSDGDIKAVKVEDVSWKQEEMERATYSVEGYKTDGRQLFKCKHCRAEAWGVLATTLKIQHGFNCVHNRVAQNAGIGQQVQS